MALIRRRLGPRRRRLKGRTGRLSPLLLLRPMPTSNTPMGTSTVTNACRNGTCLVHTLLCYSNYTLQLTTTIQLEGLQCTFRGHGGTQGRRCKLKYCRACLKNRYGLDMEIVKSRHPNTLHGKELVEYATDVDHVFK